METTDKGLYFTDKLGYMPQSKTAVIQANAAILAIDSTKSVSDDGLKPLKVDTIKGNIDTAPWGKNNDAPQQVISKIALSPILGAGLQFNYEIGYGDGVTYGVERKLDNGAVVLEKPDGGFPEVDEFFERNNINLWFYEKMVDMCTFFNSYTQFITDRQAPASRKIVEMHQLEASFSRLSSMNAKGEIEYHLYSAQFGSTTKPTKQQIAINPYIYGGSQYYQLSRKMGKMPYANGKTEDAKQYSYVVGTARPTPGRLYYSKPYWWSIFESGWFDFAIKIPEFKKALMANQATVKYVIYIAAQYWDKRWSQLGIQGDKTKCAADKATHLTEIDNWLGDHKNTGKSWMATKQQFGDKFENLIDIEVVENNIKSGEYIDDSDLTNNIISYALGVHPSLIGATPGKTGSINGTEARELFIIKQAMQKPIRQMLLQELYTVKHINNWPKELKFDVPNLVLTTLDANTGAVKVISQTP